MPYVPISGLSNEPVRVKRGNKEVLVGIPNADTANGNVYARAQNMVQHNQDNRMFGDKHSFQKYVDKDMVNLKRDVQQNVKASKQEKETKKSFKDSFVAGVKAPFIAIGNFFKKLFKQG